MSRPTTSMRGHATTKSPRLASLARHLLAWGDTRRYSAALDSDTRTYLDKLVWRAISANPEQQSMGIAGTDSFAIGQWLRGDIDPHAERFPAEQLTYLESRTRHEAETAVARLRDYMILQRSKIDTALERRTDALTELDELRPRPQDVPTDLDTVTRRLEAQHELTGYHSLITQQRRLATALSLVSLALVLVEAILIYFTLSPVFGDTIAPSFVAIATVSCSLGMLALAHLGFFMRHRSARFMGTTALIAMALVLAAIRVGVISHADTLVNTTSLCLGLVFFITMIAISWLGARLASGASVRFRNATNHERRHARRVQVLQAFLGATAQHDRDMRSYHVADSAHTQARTGRLQQDVAHGEAEFHREAAATRRRLESELASAHRRLRPVIHTIAKQMARQRHGLANARVTEDTNEESYFASHSLR